ncbi:MAG TPA: DUF4142 domain-containing protein [Pseudonocardia sp.]|nr:DUF4142 domain-containing protein [Pseudonocardia sp.]
MLRRVPRSLRRAVVVAALLAIAASVVQSWAAGSPGTGGYVQTAWGPLGPADRDLLAKVRLAGLWETPTGQQAQQQASSPEVREIGGHIAGEHVELDQKVREVADQLGVLLPSAPSKQQLEWMDEISSKTGSEYDRVFVQRLREAHGIVLPLLSEVRAGTQNELVRNFATEGEVFVRRHIGYLEGTGLVDYAALPEPPSPGLFSSERQATDLIVPGLVLVATMLAAVGLVAGIRRREAERRAAVRGRSGTPERRSTPPAPSTVVALPPAEQAVPHPIDANRVDPHPIDANPIDPNRIDPGRHYAGRLRTGRTDADRPGSARPTAARPTATGGRHALRR